MGLMGNLQEKNLDDSEPFLAKTVKFIDAIPVWLHEDPTFLGPPESVSFFPPFMALLLEPQMFNLIGRDFLLASGGYPR